MKAKKRNRKAQNTTLINNDARNKEIEALERRIARLEKLLAIKPYKRVVK